MVWFSRHWNSGTQPLLIYFDTLMHFHNITLSYTYMYMHTYNTRSYLPIYTDTLPHKITHTITHNWSHSCAVIHHNSHCHTPSHTHALTHLYPNSVSHPHSLTDIQWDDRRRPLCLAFYLGGGDLNSGPHVYSASTMPTEPSPQALSTHFRDEDVEAPRRQGCLLIQGLMWKSVSSMTSNPPPIWTVGCLCPR